MIRFLDTFNLIPGALWAAGVAVLATVLLAMHFQLLDEQLAHTASRANYASLLVDAERAARAASEKNRTKEQELRHAEATHAQEIAALRADLDAARARSAVVAGRLQDAARSTAERAGQAHADAATPELREAAAAATRLFAELREQADQHAGVLAQFATDAHLAGLACERRYDEAYKALKE